MPTYLVFIIVSIITFAIPVFLVYVLYRSRSWKFMPITTSDKVTSSQSENSSAGFRSKLLRAFKQTSRIMGYSLVGGYIIGGISFSLGFFGPMILNPDGNQGPLLGILITGPAGILAGVSLGAARALAN